MKKTPIIMDTNVLYAGLYSALGTSYRILRLIDSGIIIPVLSTTLLFEYEEILFRKQSELEIQDRQIEIILDNLCALGKFQKIHFLWRPYLSGPKDDHVLEVAVASQTQSIVTFNLQDFKGIEKFGIRAVPPAKFLEEIK